MRVELRDRVHVRRGGAGVHQHDVGLPAQELAEALVTLRLIGEAEAAPLQEHRWTDALAGSRRHDLRVRHGRHENLEDRPRAQQRLVAEEHDRRIRVSGDGCQTEAH